MVHNKNKIVKVTRNPYGSVSPENTGLIKSKNNEIEHQKFIEEVAMKLKKDIMLKSKYI